MKRLYIYFTSIILTAVFIFGPYTNYCALGDEGNSNETRASNIIYPATQGGMISLWHQLSPLEFSRGKSKDNKHEMAELENIKAIIMVPDYSYRAQLRIFENFLQNDWKDYHSLSLLNQSYMKAWCDSRNGSGGSEYDDIYVNNRLSAMRSIYMELAGRAPEAVPCNSPPLQKPSINSEFALCNSLFRRSAIGRHDITGYITNCIGNYYRYHLNQRKTDQEIKDLANDFRKALDVNAKIALIYKIYNKIDVLGELGPDGISDEQIDYIAHMLPDVRHDVRSQLALFDILEILGTKAVRVSNFMQDAISERYCIKNINGEDKMSLNGQDQKFAYPIGGFSEEEIYPLEYMIDSFLAVTHKMPNLNDCR